jgi:hypothetical protein
MKKTYLIATISVIILLILIGTGYWYMQSGKSEIQVETETPQAEVVPSVSTNPLDDKPNVNPIDQTNPFTNVKTNPFE